MESALPGIVLTRDLIAADGRRVAARGAVIDLKALREAAASAPALPVRPLRETAVAEAITEALEAEPFRHLLAAPGARARCAAVLEELRFPDAIWDELEALGSEDRVRFTHAIWTALVAARLFGCALGDAPGLSRIVGGALVHDLGMRFCAPKLREKRDHLTPEDAASLEHHPLLGALLLASSLGDAPAVRLALCHHLRSGFGYPRMARPQPLLGLDLLSVASAFAAMVASRSFRPEPFSPRGAIDQLLEEARAGHFDLRAVRLLIHCMRGGISPLPELKLPRRATGVRPQVNFHGLARAASAAPGRPLGS